MNPVYQYRQKDGSTLISFLSPADVAGMGGLPRRAIMAKAEQKESTPDRWLLSSGFLKLLHQVIRQAGPADGGLQTAARQNQKGWLYIIDLRTPQGTQGQVPPEDIVGAFEVRDGQIRPETYQPGAAYRLFTANGFPQLPPTLHTALIAALKGLGAPTRMI